MNLWQTIVLAVVEGITEFLPISSTGHLVLTSEVLGIIQSEFVKSFEIVIQLGAIMAVVWLYFKKLMTDKETLVKTAVAFLPTGILGVVAYPFVKGFLLGNSLITVIALVGGGLAMMGVEKMRKGDGGKKISELKMSECVGIGVVQSISMIPGVSRAMATILGGMGMGLSRQQATEFSFLLAIPTMAAATGLDLLKTGSSFTGSEWVTLIIGFGVAFVTAVATVKWLIQYVAKHDFMSFGVYRVGVGLLFALWFLK